MTTSFNDTRTDQLATITGPDLQQVTGGETKASSFGMYSHANNAQDCVGQVWNYANSLKLGADFAPAKSDGSMAGRLMGVNQYGNLSGVEGYASFDPNQRVCSVSGK